MKYINKYNSRADYNADSNRPQNGSTISLITDEGVVITTTGTNTILPVVSAQVGDAFVWDSIDEVAKVIKVDTIYPLFLSARYKIVGIVAYRRSNMMYVYALDQVNAIYAEGWIAKITNVTKDVPMTITINSTTTDVFTYETSDTLSDLASKMTAAISAKFEGWAVTVVGDALRVRQSYHTPAISTFTLSDEGAVVDILTGNWQTTAPAGLSALSTIERVHQGSKTSWAGCNYPQFLQYYSASGADSVDNTPLSTVVVRRSRFNEVDNPLLVEAYKTYENYVGTNMLRYPTGKDAVGLLTDGKGDTEKLAFEFTDVDGASRPAYPAAHYCHNYSVAGTPFVAGNWYLESVGEAAFLRGGLTIDQSDPLSRGLIQAGGQRLNPSISYWLSSVGSAYYSWHYICTGIVYTNTRRPSYGVRAVLAFQI